MSYILYRDTNLCDIFLCGPSPGPNTSMGGSAISPWRERMIEEFRSYATGKHIKIGVPEFGHGMTHQEGRAAFPDFEPAVWENRQIGFCAVQVFWLDLAIGERGDPESRPGFDTRFELGLALGEYPRNYAPGDKMRSLVIGMPPAGRLPQRSGLIRYYLDRLGIEVHTTMEAVVRAAIDTFNGDGEA